MAHDKYTKGVQVHVINTDKGTGLPVEHIERDTNGELWHIAQGEEPRGIREDEVAGILENSAKGQGEERSNSEGTNR